MTTQLEPGVEELYVRALLTIARSDSEIDHAEGHRLDAVIRARFPSVSLGELMFERALRADDVVKGLGVDSEGAPYRNTKVSPAELGRMFVDDAFAIVSAKDGMSSAEESALLRFAPLFGMPTHEVRRAIAELRR